MRGCPSWRYVNSLPAVLRQWSKPVGSAAYSGDYPTVGLVHCVRSIVATTFKQGLCHSSIPGTSTDGTNVTPKAGVTKGPIPGEEGVEDDNGSKAGGSSSQQQSKYGGLHKVASNAGVIRATTSTRYTETNNGGVLSYLAKQGFTAAGLEALQTKYPAVTKLDVDARVKPVLEYLQEMGLSNSQLIRMVSKLPRVLSLPDNSKLQLVLDWLLQQGVDRSKIGSILEKYPQLIGYGIESKLQSIVEWLLHHGVDRSKIGSILEKFPQIFGLSVESKLQQSVEWLLHHGVDSSKIAKILENYPQFFCYSIESKLQPKVEWLLYHGVDKKKIGSILEKNPQIFGYSIKSKLQPTTEWLLHHGVDRSKIGSILEKFPQIFGLSVESNLQQTVEWLFYHGVDRSKIGKILEKHPQFFGYSIESKWQPTLDHLASLGLRLENIHKALQSTIFGFSIETIDAKCDVLRHKYKLPKDFIPNAINTKPLIFCCDVSANFDAYLAAGLTEDEIRSMVMNYKSALMFNVSKGKNKLKLQFYLEVAQYKIQDIAEHPRLLESSFETITRRWEYAVQQKFMRHPTPKEFTRMLYKGHA